MREPPPQALHAGDSALVREALAGREEAVGGLLERLRCVPRIVVAHNRRLGHPLRTEAVEDVIQETLIAVWSKLAQFSGRASLETWVYPFCIFECLRRIRSERSRTGAQEALPSETEFPDPAPPRLELEFEALLRELEALEPAEAAVVRLKHFEDHTFETIAERLGISPNTAKTRYYRGLQRLRARLSASTRPHTDGLPAKAGSPT